MLILAFSSTKNPIEFTASMSRTPLKFVSLLKLINLIINILSGNTKDMIKDLTQKMNECSEKEEFEEAAKYRDKINTINEITEKKQKSQRLLRQPKNTGGL